MLRAPHPSFRSISNNMSVHPATRRSPECLPNALREILVVAVDGPAQSG